MGAIGEGYGCKAPTAGRIGKRAAEQGPVYVTDRGRPAHVLLTFDEYERLLGARRVIDLLGEPAGVEDVELVVPASRDAAQPAVFD